MRTGTIKMSAEQFLQLGEDPPGVRLELVDGEVIVSPSPAPRHSFVDVKLCSILEQHVDTFDLGEVHRDVDTILADFDVRRPDILFFNNESVHLIGEKAMEGPPTLAVEILSPSSIDVDRTEKFAQYRRSGVRFYWIVDPAMRTLEAFELRGRKYVAVGRWQGNAAVDGPAPFSELSFPLGKLWRKNKR